MYRRVPFPVLLVLVANAALAQQPAVPVQQQAQAAAQPAASGAVTTIRASAQLVVVDVVVTNSHHQPVAGLKASDFALTENGTPQRIRSFEEHAVPATAVAPETLPPGIFTNKPVAAPGGAVTILLLDSLNTPASSQSYLHQQLVNYLKAAAPGARIAIFGLSDHLVLLQGFNDNPAVLRDAIAKINPAASPVRSDQNGDGIQESAADFFEDSNDPLFAEVVANLRQWDAQQKSLELQTRAKLTVDAFNQLALSLSALPGRKNLIWFSGSFPLNVMPDTTDNQASDPNTPSNDNFLSSFDSEGDVSGEFRQALDRLSRGQIAVYPIDVRGITQASMFAADTTRNYGGSRGSARFSADQSQFVNDTAAENGTMTSIADATGGHAYINTNDLSRAVKDSIDQGSNFYSISYSPSDSNLDGKLRHIKVQLSHSGYTLAYRQSYYADPPDAVKTNSIFSTSEAAASADPQNALIRTNLRLAMARGAPAPTDILFKVGVVPMTPADKPEEAVAPSNTATAKAHGPWRRYSVNYLIDPAGLVFFRQPDGKARTDYDLIVFTFTAQGDLVGSFHQPLTYTGSDQDVRGLFQHGLFEHEEVSVPAKGEYFLRIAVHDLHRDHYGAVEIPSSSVDKLPLATQVPTAAATAAIPAAAPVTPK